MSSFKRSFLNLRRLSNTWSFGSSLYCFSAAIRLYSPLKQNKKQAAIQKKAKKQICHTKTVRKIEAFWQKLQLFFNCKNRLHFTISRVFKDILHVLNNVLCSVSSFCDEFVCFPRFWWSENDFRKTTKKSKIWKKL